MARQWTSLFKTLGFNESESAIYLAALEIGSAPAQAIAAKANVSRVTCYSALASLVGKRLVSSFEKGGKTFFTVESPERLIALAQARMKAMEATLNQAEAAVEELKMLQHGEKPVVKVFEGHEALKAIQEDMLESHPDTIYEIGNQDEIIKLYRKEEIDPVIKELNRRMTLRRSIFITSRPSPSPIPNYETIRLPPRGSFDFPTDIVIYGQKVALSTFRGKQISILIESADLAQTMRSMFESLWKYLKTKPPTSHNNRRDA